MIKFLRSKIKIKCVLLFLFYLTFNSIYSQSPCEIRDRNALIALFNSTGGPNWINNTNWNTTSPLNTWYGVSTDANGCVTQIDLNPTNTDAGNNNLTGNLPPEIGDLLNLEYLDLSHQNITGPIPNTIGNLQNLLWLELDSNEMTGSIPTAIGNLVNLEFLALRMNQFSGSLPEELGNLNALKYLIADQNFFTGNLPQSLGNLLNLEVLWLYENQLDGPLPLSLSNLSKLEQLLISDNQLNGMLPDFWGNLVNMQVLWLDDNQFVGQIPNSISLMSELEQLLLHNNLLTGTIPSHLENLSSLEWLSLGDNNFTGTIPIELGNISTLEKLLIYRTQVSGTIPVELGNLSNLTNLWLPFNNLTGEIPNSLTNLLNLEQLLLSDNQLEGSIPQNLNQLRNITAINVENNLLMGAIPDFSGTPIDYLYFGDNQFQFGDFEDQFDYYLDNLSLFDDNPQEKIDIIQSITRNIGTSVTLTTTASGSQNHYQWYKDGVLIADAPDSPNLILTDLRVEDAGIYHSTVTSDIVTDLTLTRNDITLVVACLTSPIADQLSDIVVCDSYTLPTLTMNNNYYTAPDAGGIKMDVGDTIFESQTIYIFAGTLGCSDESNFTVTISDLVQVDSFDDIRECESYTLPPLSVGAYFTESNGSGQTLNAGDILNTSQTIYIYLSSGFCSDEKSFSLEIDSGECEISVAENEIVFPNFFTPNNDGINDSWKRMDTAYNVQGYVYIYDRYGKLLKEMDAVSGWWDGTYNGSKMPSTDYWYRFVNTVTGDVLANHFTLKR